MWYAIGALNFALAALPGNPFGWVSVVGGFGALLAAVYTSWQDAREDARDLAD